MKRGLTTTSGSAAAVTSVVEVGTSSTTVVVGRRRRRSVPGSTGSHGVGAVAVGVVGVDAAVDVVVDAIGAPVAGDDEHLLFEAGRTPGVGHREPHPIGADLIRVSCGCNDESPVSFHALPAGAETSSQWGCNVSPSASQLADPSSVTHRAGRDPASLSGVGCRSCVARRGSKREPMLAVHLHGGRGAVRRDPACAVDRVWWKPRSATRGRVVAAVGHDICLSVAHPQPERAGVAVRSA